MHHPPPSPFRYLNERAAVNRDLHGQFKMSRVMALHRKPKTQNPKPQITYPQPPAVTLLQIDRPPAKVAEELRGSFGIEIVESKKPRCVAAHNNNNNNINNNNNNPHHRFR